MSDDRKIVNFKPRNIKEVLKKAALTKMISLMMDSRNLGYEEALKYATFYFHEKFKKHPDSVHRMLITEYQIALYFAEFVFTLDGFMEFFKNPKHTESIKALISTNEVKNVIRDEKQVEKVETKKVIKKVMNKENELACQKSAFKALKILTKKGLTFEEAVTKISVALPKQKVEYADVSKNDIISFLAIEAFAFIQEMKADPLKYIKALIKLLDASQKEELKKSL